MLDFVLAMQVGRTGGLEFATRDWCLWYWTRRLRLEEDYNEYGRWPGKKFLHSFWSIIKELNLAAANDVEQHVCPSRDSDEIFQFLLRRLAGLNEYQQWNPFRPVRAAPDVVS